MHFDTMNGTDDCAKVSMQCLSYVTWGPYSMEKEASFNKMMTLKSLDFG